MDVLNPSLPPATEQQPLLPLDFVPASMRGHGLREAHSAPLVGLRTTGGDWRTRRTTPADAWREIDPYQAVEWPRTGTSFAALVLDCDSREAVERAHACAVGAGPLPTPNLTVTRLASGHLHVAWMLRRPVLRGEHARENPLKAFARVSEFYCAALDADRGYVGVLAHNPLDVEHYATAWLRRDPFSLAELGRAVPHRWRRPTTQPGTAAGRNSWLFERLMRFGGSPHASDAEVEQRAEVLNAGLLFPLDAAEVAGIVKSVNGHYRAQWRARGWHRADFLAHQQKRGRMATNQSAAGLRSGEARRAAVAARDRRLLAFLEAGESTRQAATAEGVDQATVVRVRDRLRRERLSPGEGDARTANTDDPPNGGMSRERKAKVQRR